MDTSRIAEAQARAAELEAAKNETLTLVKELWDEKQRLTDEASEVRQTIVGLMPMLRESFTGQQIAEGLGISANAVSNLIQASKPAKPAKKGKKGTTPAPEEA